MMNDFSIKSSTSPSEHRSLCDHPGHMSMKPVLSPHFPGFIFPACATPCSDTLHNLLVYHICLP